VVVVVVRTMTVTPALVADEHVVVVWTMPVTPPSISNSVEMSKAHVVVVVVVVWTRQCWPVTTVFPAVPTAVLSSCADRLPAAALLPSFFVD